MAPERRHVAAVISSLGPGGAERVLTELSGAWTNRGDRVTIVTWSDAATDFYPLPPGVERVALGLATPATSLRQALRGNWRRIRGLRRVLRTVRPTHVVAFGGRTNVLALLASRALGVPVVVSERIHPPRSSDGWVTDVGRRLTYSFARRVVVQTQTSLAWLRARIPRAHGAVIPNPVGRGIDGQADTLPAGREPLVLAVGRLTPQKGFRYLLDAWARVQDEFPRWRLAILGEGPLRSELEARVRRLSPGDRVELVGLVPRPEEWYRRCSVFVLPSVFEGFPNALLEAMSLGAAVIAADCEAGPAELVEDGRSGLLVPPADPTALALALRRLLSDEGLRCRLGAEAALARDRFSLRAVVDLWDRALSEDPREAE